MDIKRLALIALLLPGANFPAGAAPELVNGIVAIVNETIITEKEARQFIEPAIVALERQLLSRQQYTERAMEIYKDGLNQLIERQLTLGQLVAAEIIVAWLDAGRPIWRYLPARLSGDTLEAQTWANGQRFALRWSGRDGGSATITGATLSANQSYGIAARSAAVVSGWAGESISWKWRTKPMRKSRTPRSSLAAYLPGRAAALPGSSGS